MNYWNLHPNGAHTAEGQGLPYYLAIEKYRYRAESPSVDFRKWKGKAVLEVGCGLGTDLRQFAYYGANTTGIDQANNAIELARHGFLVFSLSGDFHVGNGQQMPFKSDGFDMVYCHGVLHHAENPQQMLKEIYRVLKPGGEANVMVYYRYALARVFRRYLDPVFSDGEIPRTKVYSRLQVDSLFRDFRHVEMETRQLYVWCPIKRLETWLARRWGLFLCIKARKAE